MQENFTQTFTAELEAASHEANHGCGLSYELYEERFQAACDRLLRGAHDTHYPEALELAKAAGYNEEYTGMEVQEDGCSLTGIDMNYCHCGRHP